MIGMSQEHTKKQPAKVQVFEKPAPDFGRARAEHSLAIMKQTYTINQRLRELGIQAPVRSVPAKKTGSR
jgi:hypothetical protein